MAYDSFSAFIAALEKAGELKRIRTPVATELEITELADREMKSPGGGKALLFEQPTISNGVVSPFPGGDQYHGQIVEAHGSLSMSAGERGRRRRRTWFVDEGETPDFHA